MDLANIIANIYTATNRPDLSGETLQAAIASTLKMHTMDFWFRDIQTAQVVFDTSAYVQVLDTNTIPKFRTTAYARKNDPTLATYQQNPLILPPLYNSPIGIPYGIDETMRFFKIITPTSILDKEYGDEILDTAYQVGDSLMFKSLSTFQYLLYGWYAFPNVDTTTTGTVNITLGENTFTISVYPLFSSWVARDYPYAIIYDAASAILQSIGMTDAARKFDNPDPNNPGLVASHVQALTKANIVAEGR